MAKRTDKFSNITNELLKKLNKFNEINEEEFVEFVEELDLSEKENNELQKFLKDNKIKLIPSNDFGQAEKNFAQVNDVVAMYRQDCSKYKLLTEEEEIELGKRIKKGDKDAVDELVEHNLRLVFFVIKEKKLSSVGSVSFEDMVAAGNIGLIKAAEKFDYESGRFTTYATWWIWCEIQNTIKGEGQAFKVSERLVVEKKQYYVALNKFIEENNEQPTDSQLRSILGWNNKKLKEIKRFAYLSSVVSLDQSLTDDNEGITYSDLQNDEDAEKDIFQNLDKEDMNIEIDEYLKHCDKRKQIIIEKAYGLHGHKAESLAQIGKELGISRERVRQLKEEAIYKMKEVRQREEHEQQKNKIKNNYKTY